MIIRVSCSDKFFKKRKEVRKNTTGVNTSPAKQIGLEIGPMIFIQRIPTR